MSEIFSVSAFRHMNSFTILSVFATTIIAIFLYKKYSKTKLPEGTTVDDEAFEKSNGLWYFLFFWTEVGSFTMGEFCSDFADAIFVTIGDTIFHVIVFFICYGVLTLAKVDKDNAFNRCEKAFVGVIILSFGLIYLAEYAIENGLG